LRKHPAGYKRVGRLLEACRDGPAGRTRDEEMEAMDLLGLLILLIVAAIVGAIGEMVAGVKVPGGWIGSILVGFIGAWLGSMIINIGPRIGTIPVISAVIGAILFVLVLRLIMGARRGTV
jgi:uncharacterized membrane protein YeaQ/YmgE (transglycosylase-associated protein family)